MNLPNKLSVLRIALVPIFAVLLLVDFPFHYGAAAVVFILASVTDFLDGKIARAQGIVTRFGKFIDPLADKMLVVTALIGLVGLNLVPSYIVMIIIIREFTVTSIRLVAAGNGTVIAANMWGKVKTVTQMIAIIYILFIKTVQETGIVVPYAFTAEIAGVAFMGIATLFTIISGIVYVKDNINCINEIN